MYQKQNLINIKILLFFILFFYSCKPKFIDETVKSTMGFYAYKINDSIQLKINNNDSTILFLYTKNNNFQTDMITGNNFEKFEYFFANKSEDFHLTVTDNYLTNNIFSLYYKKADFFETKIIDNKKYDSVYYFYDEHSKYNLYSSKKYGFIKIWNDTLVITFERY
jgi:Ca2+-binding RTX toxin-like protein